MKINKWWYFVLGRYIFIKLTPAPELQAGRLWNGGDIYEAVRRAKQELGGTPLTHDGGSSRASHYFACHSYDNKHACHNALQHGRHLLRLPARHQRERRRGRRLLFNGDIPGDWLHPRHGFGKHDRARARRGRERHGERLRLDLLFQRDNHGHHPLYGRAAIPRPADDAARIDADDTALRAQLRKLDTARRADNVRLLRHEQHPALRGTRRLRDVRACDRRSAEHRARPDLYLHPRPWHLRRGACDAAQPVHQLLDYDILLPARKEPRETPPEKPLAQAAYLL